MQDVVELEIEAPTEVVAERYSDPANSPKWMTDLKRYEPISGEQGEVGSKYRLLTTKELDFVATVVARDLPDSVVLLLDSPSVAVSINTTFAELPSGKTKLVSAEEFRFKSVLGRAASLFARRGIHKAHREQMRSFKRFVESDQPTAA
jgi:hypothetical protein